MNNNTLPLVTYQQARRLKMAGFDWPTRKWYDIRALMHESAYEQCHNSGGTGHETKIAAPSVALALEWFREVKRIQCGTMPKRIFDLVWYAWWYSVGASITATSDGISKHEDCASNLLDKLLELIENENHD